VIFTHVARNQAHNNLLRPRQNRLDTPDLEKGGGEHPWPESDSNSSSRCLTSRKTFLRTEESHEVGWTLCCQQWFQTSAAMLMKPAVFWIITRRRVVIVYRRFGTTYRSHPLLPPHPHSVLIFYSSNLLIYIFNFTVGLFVFWGTRWRS
jgi:hypothetical protein